MKRITIKTLALLAIAGLGIMSSCGGAKEDVKTETNTEVEAPATEEAPAVEEAPVAETAQLDGKALYEAKCKVCHQANGQGVPGAFPPLAKSDYLKDKMASIKTSINGLQGEIVVNGQTYNSVMAPVPLSDEELLAVMNYVYSSWGNEGSVTMEDIKAAR